MEHLFASRFVQREGEAVVGVGGRLKSDIIREMSVV